MLSHIPHTSSDSVLERAFIEDIGRESAERRVHTVLHLQANGSDAQHHQSFEERLGETCLSCLFTHDHWTKLAVITHQDQLGQTREKAIKLSVTSGSTVKNILDALKRVWAIPAWLPELQAPCTLAQ